MGAAVCGNSKWSSHDEAAETFTNNPTQTAEQTHRVFHCAPQLHHPRQSNPSECIALHPHAAFFAHKNLNKQTHRFLQISLFYGARVQPPAIR
jgi:hypothetical protein